MFVWDEKKRQANLVKHGFDFVDAWIVYDNPSKATFSSVRAGEPRLLDIAVAEYLGVTLSLVYVERGESIRIISLRTASRKERRIYAEARKSD